MKTIYRYEVPVDDAWHTILTHGNVVHVACRTPAVVEVWAHAGGVASRRMFRVFGTGQPLPDDDSVARLVHVGTALTPDGSLVWHLFELVEGETPHRCPACRELTVYQSYSGGREWYCPACKSDGLYPEGSAPPRVQLLADGRYDELRQEMRAELAKRHAAGVE